MKKLICCVLSAVMIANTAFAVVTITVDGRKIGSYSEADYQKIINFLREIEIVSPSDNDANIMISVYHGSPWSLENGLNALKSYGLAGIDYLSRYGLKGLEFLKANGGEGWRYIKECGVAGLKFLKVCGQAGLEYILSKGADGWEYLQRCGDAGIEFLKSLGRAAVYFMLHGDQFNYFVHYLKDKGIEILMPYALEALDYLREHGIEGFDYLKECGKKGFDFLLECGEAGLDYVLSFGKAGLDWLLSFGEEGWNFLMSYYNPEMIITKLSGDMPVLGHVNPKDERPVKNYLETYKTLGRDPFESYGKNAVDVLNSWQPGTKSNKVPQHNGVLEAIIPNAANDDSEIKKFLDADALEWIDFVSDFKDRDYFTDGSLTFSREYVNSLSSYGFIDREKLKNTIRSFYGGGFSLLDNMRFTFRLSGSTVLWNNTISSTGEEAFFSLKTLKPGKGGDVLNLALRLLQTVRTTKTDRHSAVRLFFRTDNDAIRVVAVIRDDMPTTYYLASNRPLIERYSLVRTLMDADRIALDASMENLMFTLPQADEKLKSGVDLDTCLDVFISQIIGEIQGRNQ